jgi:chromate transporter
MAPAPVREVAGVFLKLGVIGFGGPAAHVAMMRDEVVRRRSWVDEHEFLDLVGATNLIPGPNSTELAIHLGHLRAGGRGLVVAGVCFIVPAVAIVSVLAWMYERYGTEPAVVDVRYGILPVIVAIVANAVVGLGRTALVTPLSMMIAAGGVAAYLLGVHELLVLGGAGAVAAGWSARRHLARLRSSAVLLPAVAASSASGTAVSLWRLFLVFLEVGSILYGSGYVLLAFLERSLVDDLGWISSEVLLDAITVGQVTPGPVFTTATFIGWQIDGPAGAAVATVGIFLPSFVFVWFLGRIVPWMRARPTAKAFLAGVTAASLGLMGGVLVDLAGEALVDPVTVIVAAVALAVLVRTSVNSAWLVLGGVAVGVAHLVLT